MGQMNLMLAPLTCGARVVILDRFTPEIAAQALSHYRCTYWVGATTMIIALLNLPNISDYDLSSLRFVWTGGAPIRWNYRIGFMTSPLTRPSVKAMGSQRPPPMEVHARLPSDTSRGGWERHRSVWR